MKTLIALTTLSLALVACGKDEKSSAEPARAVAPPAASTAPTPAEAVPPAASVPAAGPAGEARGAAADAPASQARRGAARARAGTPPAAGATHTVARGDTLSAIARRNGVSAADLAKWNDVRDPRRLRVGQQLRLTPP